MSRTVLILLSLAVACHAWSVPFYPVQRAPMRMRYTRYAPPPPPPKPHRIPIPVHETTEKYQRPKRGHDHDFYGHDHDHDQTRGVTGPVHTFVKTDKNANYKWGVRHHVGNKYAS
ncbi:uncharacterized protein LOC134742842 [Cydia strobilella]|uniref:uncharacterized protein LOC134742842 n=1 Tax=Cydia strobilella TaxID=1100964 RepID=UPI003006BBA4